MARTMAANNAPRPIGFGVVLIISNPPLLVRLPGFNLKKNIR